MFACHDSRVICGKRVITYFDITQLTKLFQRRPQKRHRGSRVGWHEMGTQYVIILNGHSARIGSHGEVLEIKSLNHI